MCINRSLKSKKLAQLMTLFKKLKQNTETDKDSVADYNAGSESHPAALPGVLIILVGTSNARQQNK